MRVIHGRNALVTGAAGGIGRAISLDLARQGANLWLVDIDQAGMDETARHVREHGVNVVCYPCDLSDPAQISRCVEQVRSQWRRLHILINNAGICYIGRTRFMTLEQWRRLLEINLHAPIQLIQELLPLLVEQDQAHIVNISSIFGLVGYRRIAAYQTSKYALVGLSEALRNELVGENIGVSVICPGFVRGTELFTANKYVGPSLARKRPSWWMYTTPEAVAHRTIHAIRWNRAVLVPSLPWLLLWHFKRHLPRTLDLLVQIGWGWGPKLRARRRKKKITHDAAKPRREPTEEFQQLNADAQKSTI